MRAAGVRLCYTAAWFLLVVDISFSTAAYAGAGVWTSGGPYGGTTVALAINPSNPTTLYAGTDGGGVFKSTDSGGTWTPASAGLTNLYVYAFAINPANPATLYAGTLGGGIFRSTNSGGSWAAANRGLTNSYARALAINSTTPDILFAGTDDGVFKSTDSGNTWATANAGLTDLHVYAFAINPTNPATLFVGTLGGGVFKSTDSGSSWTPASAGLTNAHVGAFAINPSSPATLYAVTGDGVFKSTDSGGTWTPANAGLTNLHGESFVSAIAINPANPATLYAGTSGGIFKSTDSGGTWAAANAGLTNAYVHAFAINPSNPSTLYSGTSGGVFKSTDSGGTWGAASAGMTNVSVLSLAINPANPAKLYAGTVGAIFKSSDSGGTWTAANAGMEGDSAYALAIDPANPATLYAATGRGIFKSTDSGNTWAVASSGLTDSWVTALAIDPKTPAVLFAGCFPGPNAPVGTIGGVFKSTDSGASWVASSTGLPDSSVGALAFDPANPATLYVGTDLGVFKSTDSGGTWAAANAGMTNKYVSALAINPVDPATLYAGTFSGVFKSTDSGSTWAAANEGMTNLNVVALIINPANPATLYAGTWGGVFKSTDSGSTWATANAGLPDQFVQALALDPQGATTLFAGLRADGVWQLTPATDVNFALLPTSAHAPGVHGAFYTTDVSIANTGPAAASFTMKFLGNNQDGSNGPEQTFNLEPGKSSFYFDVLGSVFDLVSAFGAILITSRSLSLDIASVTSTSGFGGTFGQTVPAVSSSDLIPAGVARSILYVREGDGFRSNLVLASSSLDSTNVDVALVSPDGSTLATKQYSVPPNGMRQVNRVVRDMGVSGAVTGARLVLSSWTAGAAFTGMVSVLDETTNDPTTVVTQPASVPGSAPYVWLLPTSAHSSGASGAFYTTNVAFANVGFAPATFTMKFLGHNQDGSEGPEQTFNLEAGKSVTYFDVLGSVFDQNSTFGAIRVTSDTFALNIVSVTSTPGSGGTMSQTVPAVHSSDLIPSSSPRSILYIREGDGFRSNLILASNANVSTTVDVALVFPGGTIVAAKSYSIPPNGMTQVNRIVRDMGVPGPVTGARLVLSSPTPGAAFTGFGSVIDEVTNDPTTVEAR